MQSRGEGLVCLGNGLAPATTSELKSEEKKDDGAGRGKAGLDSGERDEQRLDKERSKT